LRKEKLRKKMKETTSKSFPRTEITAIMDKNIMKRYRRKYRGR
jgi:hypothetical protein